MLNKISQEVLHARRPTLNYISPAICEAIFSGTSFASVVLDELTAQAAITGLRAEYDPITGRFRISWDAYPFVQCYNVYKANDPSQPAGTYTLFISCTTDNSFTVTGCPECFLITAVTLVGETPFAGPVCTVCPPPPPVNPDEPPIVFYNVEYTAPCPSGQCGGDVTIPAGTYSSLFSQANADAQAIDAGNAALVCTPCVLPPDYYAQFATNFGGFDPGPPPPYCPVHPCEGPRGRITVVNNANQPIKHLFIEWTRGVVPVTTAYYNAFSPGFTTLTYINFDWDIIYLAGDPPFDNPLFYPVVDMHVIATMLDDTVLDGGTLNFDTTPGTENSQVLVFWVGGEPPCIC